MALQARHEMLEHMAIAEAAIAGQHHLQEHVLAEQDAVGKAGLDQLGDSPRVLLVGGGLRVLIGIVIVHADHVVYPETRRRGTSHW